VRYEERGQGYRDVEKVGKHCSRAFRLLKMRAPRCFEYLDQITHRRSVSYIPANTSELDVVVVVVVVVKICGAG